MIDYLQKFRLDKKTAFVLGGLGLIGRQVSAAFASAGAKTIILDLEIEKAVTVEAEIERAGYDVHCRTFDCGDMEHLEPNFSNIVNKFGCPDIFINCSYPRTEDWGISFFQGVTLTSFRKNVDIHMNSYAWLARLAAEAMVKAKSSGSIIQFGSTYGIVGQDLNVYEGTEMHENMTYAAIKGGITNLTRQMASYYGQFNIRVNTLCPGGLEGHIAGKKDKQNSVFIKQYNKKTPLKRLGQADEIATVALFLASEAASYITGATIMVDGGWTAI
jgi:NAD(P)-dependent dehydrogenase (short-subunit alcohol dehydrogenase family)